MLGQIFAEGKHINSLDALLWFNPWYRITPVLKSTLSPQANKTKRQAFKFKSPSLSLVILSRTKFIIVVTPLIIVAETLWMFCIASVSGKDRWAAYLLNLLNTQSLYEWLCLPVFHKRICSISSTYYDITAWLKIIHNYINDIKFYNIAYHLIVYGKSNTKPALCLSHYSKFYLVSFSSPVRSILTIFIIVATIFFPTSKACSYITK